MAARRSATELITLPRFILNEARTDATDLAIVLDAIACSAKFISAHVRKAGLADLLGFAGGRNASMEQQQPLDVLANAVLKNSLRATGRVRLMISEEDEEPIVVVPGSRTEKAAAEKAATVEAPEDTTLDSTSPSFAVCFDPLDGSSNIACLSPIGTIFAIYRASGSGRSAAAGFAGAALKPGRELVAAGYSLYGSATVLVLTTTQHPGVNLFTLDPSMGEFLLTSRDLRVPERGHYYSINEGTESSWDPAVRAFVEQCKRPAGGVKHKSLRYTGSLVADAHRTLLEGGIFLYPSTKEAPQGKLRLLYECNPMALIFERAGGHAVADGKRSILDLNPVHIHQRTPVFLGSTTEVERLIHLYTSLEKPTPKGCPACVEEEHQMGA